MTFRFLIKSCSLYISVRTYKTGSVRVRFAPSPTGYLHLGGLRTALYNFLFARKCNGKFILRIEDTDNTRLVPGATDQLIKDLRWAGIKFDEGPLIGGSYGPYLQSERLNVYKEQVKTLLDNGSAYHCFCAEKRLQLLRRAALKRQEVPKYDNKCRHLPADVVKSRLLNGDTSCIRFKLSNAEESFDDMVYGEISYNISLTEGDPVIMKSDGYPTYHFANVVDDHFMEISHVFRGVEWQISTTKHILLYRAFQWEPPQYGHLPLLMNSDGTKLSKRQGDIQISHYRDNEIIPLALVNFIIHSGGGFTKDLQKNVKPRCHSIDELVSQFDISLLNNHSGKLMADRLLEFNRLALKEKLQNEKDHQILVQQVKDMVQRAFPQRAEDKALQLDDIHIRSILKWAENRISKLSDLVSKDFEFIWIVPNVEITNSLQVDQVELLKKNFISLDDLKAEKVNELFKTFCKENKIKFSHFMQGLRSILSGLKEGPSVAEIIVILGKEKTLQRLDLYLNKVKEV